MTQYANELPKHDIGEIARSLPRSTDHAMSGIDDSEDVNLLDTDHPTKQHDETLGTNGNATPPTPQKNSPPWTPKKILTKDDVEMPDRLNLKFETHSSPPRPVHPDTDAWLKGEYHESKMSLPKPGPDKYASDPRKLEIIEFPDVIGHKGLAKA